MIQNFSDAFRLDAMVVWYVTSSDAFLFLTVILAMALAIRFHISRSQSLTESPSVNGEVRTTIIRRILWIVEVVAITWIYWINAEFLALGAGARVGLCVVTFLLVYTLVLSLHRNHSQPASTN